MKKQTLAILACTASLLFAQAVQVPTIDDKLSCRVGFEAVQNPLRDASADRIYAQIRSRLYLLEEIPKDKRNGQPYETELKLCDLHVKLLRLQLEKAEVNQRYVDAQKSVSQVKDDLIKSCDVALGNERERSERVNLDSKRVIADKDYMLLKQKEEAEKILLKQKEDAEKKLEALRSKNVSVYKDARGTILSMNSDILFETAKWDLKPELKENLAEVAGILKTLITSATVIVEGHTDNVGKPEANLKLSNQRAKSVLDYLASRGVEKKRLASKGLGATKPVADNSTDEGKAKNRRVELVIKDK